MPTIGPYCREPTGCAGRGGGRLSGISSISPSDETRLGASLADLSLWTTSYPSYIGDTPMASRRGLRPSGALYEASGDAQTLATPARRRLALSGAGPIQLTGRPNYQRFPETAGVPMDDALLARLEPPDRGRERRAFLGRSRGATASRIPATSRWCGRAASAVILV